MPSPVLYLPVITTLFSLAFSAALLRRYLTRGHGPHLLVWAIGILVYGVGTFTEAFTSVFGYPMPQRSSVPVLKFSISTSALSRSRSTASRPSGRERSRATPRVLRLTPMK